MATTPTENVKSWTGKAKFDDNITAKITECKRILQEIQKGNTTYSYPFELLQEIAEAWHTHQYTNVLNSMTNNTWYQDTAQSQMYTGGSVFDITASTLNLVLDPTTYAGGTYNIPMLIASNSEDATYKYEDSSGNTQTYKYKKGTAVPKVSYNTTATVTQKGGTWSAKYGSCTRRTYNISIVGSNIALDISGNLKHLVQSIQSPFPSNMFDWASPLKLFDCWRNPILDIQGNNASDSILISKKFANTRNKITDQGEVCANLLENITGDIDLSYWFNNANILQVPNLHSGLNITNMAYFYTDQTHALNRVNSQSININDYFANVSFKNCSSVERMLYNNPMVYGDAKALKNKILSENPNIEHTGCFANCPNLSNLPSEWSWKY